MNLLIYLFFAGLAVFIILGFWYSDLNDSFTRKLDRKSFVNDCIESPKRLKVSLIDKLIIRKVTEVNSGDRKIKVYAKLSGKLPKQRKGKEFADEIPILELTDNYKEYEIAQNYAAEIMQKKREVHDMNVSLAKLWKFPWNKADSFNDK